MAHCSTAECKESAQLLCEHEHVLTAQHLIDQYRTSCSMFKKQDGSKQGPANYLHDYSQTLCGVNTMSSNAQTSLNEFYIKPCNLASFQNKQKCTIDKCCSYNHQVFGNNTRAGTGHFVG